MSIPSSGNIDMNQVKVEITGAGGAYDFNSLLGSSRIIDKSLPFDFRTKFLGYQHYIDEIANPYSASFGYSAVGSGNAVYSTIYSCGNASQIASIPPWVDVRDSTNHFLFVGDYVQHGEQINFYPNSVNYGGSRSGGITFSTPVVGNIYQYRNTGSFYIGVSQDAVPPTTQYIWVIGDQETFTIWNNTHGMMDNSSSYFISFNHDFVGDEFKPIAISKMGGSVLASMSVRFRPTGIISTGGTLSQTIQAGDTIYIQIGLSAS